MYDLAGLEHRGAQNSDWKMQYKQKEKRIWTDSAIGKIILEKMLRTMSPYIGEAKGLVMKDRNIKSNFEKKRIT